MCSQVRAVQAVPLPLRCRQHVEGRRCRFRRPLGTSEGNYSMDSNPRQHLEAKTCLGGIYLSKLNR